MLHKQVPWKPPVWKHILQSTKQNSIFWPKQKWQPFIRKTSQGLSDILMIHQCDLKKRNTKMMITQEQRLQVFKFSKHKFFSFCYLATLTPGVFIILQSYTWMCQDVTNTCVCDMSRCFIMLIFALKCFCSAGKLISALHCSLHLFFLVNPPTSAQSSSLPSLAFSSPRLFPRLGRQEVNTMCWPTREITQDRKGRAQRPDGQEVDSTV